MLESNLRTASVEDGRDSTSQELHRGLLFFCLDPGVYPVDSLFCPNIEENSPEGMSG
jgi:hypothetical protein